MSRLWPTSFFLINCVDGIGQKISNTIPTVGRPKMAVTCTARALVILLVLEALFEEFFTNISGKRSGETKKTHQETSFTLDMLILMA